jgi:hypothetical protein
MASTKTLTGARASLTAAAGDTIIAAALYDTLLGSGSNSLLAAANNDYLAAGTGINTLVGATLSSNFTTLQGNGHSTLGYAGANNTFILNSSVTGASPLNGFSDYKTDSIVAASGPALARSSIIQTSLNKFDLSNTLNHGAGVANISRLIYTGSGNATLHGNNQNDSIVGGLGSNYLSVAGTTGMSTLDGHFSTLGDTLLGNGFSSLIGSSLNDTYIISETVTSGKVTQSDKIFENANGGANTISLSGVSGTSALFDLSNTSLNGNAILYVNNLAYSGSLNATLYGNALNNSIHGGTGNNFLQGNGGKDTLDASASTSSLGSNTLVGSANAAGSLIGGSGSNTFYLNNSGDAIVTQANSTNAIIVTSSVVNNATTPLSLDFSTLTGSQKFSSISYLGNGPAKIIGDSVGGSTINAAFSTGATLGDGGGSSDSLLGSAQYSNYFYSHSITANTIQGGNSTDTLAISIGSQTISDANFGKISNIELLSLSGGGNNVSLGSSAATEGISSLIGGTGTSSVNAASYTGANNGSTGLYFDASADTLSPILYMGSSLGDLLKVSTPNVLNASTLTGGVGIDTLMLAASDSTLVGFGGTKKGFEVLALSGQNNNISGIGASGLKSIYGGMGGHDTIDASTAATGIVVNESLSANGDTLIASTVTGSVSTLIGSSSGGNLFQLGTTNHASLVGGAGNDTLKTSATTLGAGSFNTDSSIEVLQLGSAANVVLDSGAKTAGISTIIGGTGNDSIDASGFNTLSGSAPRGLFVDLTQNTAAGNNGSSYTTSGGSDLIRIKDFTIFNGTGSAVVKLNGGGGTDTLQVTGSGTTLGLSQAAKISNIEALSLSGGANTIVNLGASGISSIFGGTQGNDTFDTAASTLSLYLNGSQGTLGDLFLVNGKPKLSQSTLIGSTAANDTLRLTGGSTNFVDSDFKNLGSIETLSLVGSNSTIIAGNNASAANLSTFILDQTPNTLDASAYFKGITVVDSLGSGSDSLVGGSGNDFFVLKGGANNIGNAIVNGTSGVDTLALTSPSTLSGAGRISNISVLSLTGGHDSVNNLGQTGISTIVGALGGDTISAASATKAVLINETGAITGNLYAFSDSTILGSSTIKGNELFGAQGDTLQLTGGGLSITDTALKNDSGIRSLYVTGANNKIQLNNTSNYYAFNAGIRNVILDGSSNGLNGNNIIDDYGINFLNPDTLTFNGSTTLNAGQNGSAVGFNTIVLTAGHNKVQNLSNILGNSGFFYYQSPTIVGSAQGYDTLDITEASNTNFFNGGIYVDGSNATHGDTLSDFNPSPAFIYYQGNSLVGGKAGGNLFEVGSQNELAYDLYLKGAGSDTLALYDNKLSLTAEVGNYFTNFRNVSGIKTLELSSSLAGTYDLASSDMNGVGISSVYGSQSTDPSATLGGNQYFIHSSIYLDSSRSTLGDNIGINSAYLAAGSYSSIGGNSETVLKNSTIKGGSGSDTLTYIGTSLASGDFVNKSGIEVLSLTAGLGTYNIGTDAQNAGISTIVAASPFETINGATATKSLTFIDDAGDNFLSGTSLGDLFQIGYDQNTSAGYDGFTTISGGQGIDTLYFISNHSVSDFDLRYTTGVEIISLEGGTNTVNLGLNAYTAGIQTVYGGSISNTLDVSNLPYGYVTLDGSKAIQGDSLVGVSSFSANATLIGETLASGTGTNYFVLPSTAFLSHHSLVGGTSETNILQISNYSQTIGDDIFKKDPNNPNFVGTSSYLNELSLQGGINSVVLGSNFDTWKSASSPSQPFTLTSAANYSGSQDTLNVSATASSIVLDSSKTDGDSLIGSTLGGSNTLIGAQSGGNTFVLKDGAALSNDSLFGGTSNNDTLAFTSSVTIGTGNFTKSKNIAALETRAAGNNIVLGSDALTTGITTLIGGLYGDTGGDTFDVSAYKPSGKSVILEITDKNYLDNLVFTGSGNFDTLRYSAAGVSVTDDDLADITNLAVLQATGGTNHFLIGDGYENAGIKTLIGGTGNDTVDLTSADYTAPNGGMTYSLSGGYTVQSLIQNLQDATIVGAGSGNPPNLLSIFDSGTIVDSQFGGMSQAKLDNLSLSSTGSNNVTLGVDASRIAGANGLNVDLGDQGDQLDLTTYTGKMNVVGGSGNDLVTTSQSEFSQLKFQGNGGIDTVQISGSSAVSIVDSSLAGSSYQVLALSNGSNFVNLTGANSSGLSTIYGAQGFGVDTISVQGFTAAQGVDMIIDYSKLGRGTAYDSLTGGAGVDTLQIGGHPLPSESGVFDENSFSQIHSIEALALNAYGGNRVNLGFNASAAGIATVYGSSFDGINLGGFDTINAAAFGKAINIAIADTLTLRTDSIVGSGYNDTLTFTSSGQVLNDNIFTSVSTKALAFTGSANQVTLGANAHLAGITSVYGGTGGDTIVQDSLFGTNPLYIKEHGSGNLISVGTANQLNIDTVIGGDTNLNNTLVITNSGQTLGSAAIGNLVNISTIQFSGGKNSAYVNTSDKVSKLIGATGSDLLSVSVVTSNATLDGGESAIGGADTLTGSTQGGADSFVLANTTGTYYGTTAQGFTPGTATNFAYIQNLTANDQLILSQADLNGTHGNVANGWGNYSFGAAANGDNTSTHFGFYDYSNGKNVLIADITESTPLAVIHTQGV